MPRTRRQRSRRGIYAAKNPFLVRPGDKRSLFLSQPAFRRTGDNAPRPRPLTGPGDDPSPGAIRSPSPARLDQDLAVGRRAAARSPALTAIRCRPRGRRPAPARPRRSAGRRRARGAARSAAGTASIEAGSRRWSATFRPGASTPGNHGPPVVKPPSGPASHCIGLRWRVAAEAVDRRLAAGPVGRAELVALVDERGPGQGEQQQRGGARADSPRLVGRPGEVVVGEHPGEPGERRRAAAITDRRRAGSQGACRNSKEKARSRCSR